MSLRHFVRAPPEDVWAVLTQLEGWTYWAGVGAVTLDVPGIEQRQGVGAERTVHLPGLPLRERITALEPPERLEYELVQGLPVRDLRGRIDLERRPHGTVVQWSIQFQPRVPGTKRLLAAALRAGLSHVLQRLENRLAPLDLHRSECPYADAPGGHPPGLLLRGRRAAQRALLRARTG